MQKPTGKVLASIFWDQDGTLPIDHLPKGQTANAEHYLSLLVQLRDIFKEKRRGKFTKGDLVLRTRMPRAHRALATQKKKMAYLGLQYLDHPPCSPDLVPSDYHLFPELKKTNLKVAIFRPTWRSLLPRRPVWTDNLVNFFFEWLSKFRAMG